MRWLVIFLVGDKNRRLGLVDISKAFNQSDYLHADERIFAWLPEYIGAHGEEWSGFVATDHKKQFFENADLRKVPACDVVSGDRYGILLYRPLYGSRDAPYRWWVKISQVSRQNGYTQFHCDTCLYGKYRKLTADEMTATPSVA